MECFAICLNKLEGSLCPHFYRPEFQKLGENLQRSKHRKLGDVVQFSAETWNQKEFFGEQFPYIEINEIDLASGEIKHVIYYDKQSAPSRARMIVRESDIIVSTTRPNRGAIALIDKSKNGFIASTGFAILRDLKIKDISREYLFHVLRTDFCLHQMLQRSSGGNYPAITAEELKKLLIPIPAFEIQNRIVETMQSAYEQKNQKQQEAEALLDSINDYVLDELGIKLPELKEERYYPVTFAAVKGGRLDTSYYQPKYYAFEKAIKEGKYPVHKLGEFIGSIHYGASVKNIYVKEGIPLLRILNLRPNEIDLSEVVNLPFDKKEEVGNAYIKEGDFLISRSGTIGITAIVPKKADGFAYGSFMIRFRIEDNEIESFYVSIIMNSKIVQEQIKRVKIGAIQGNITIPSIKNLLIPLPLLAIQQKIAKEVNSRREKAKQLKQDSIKLIEDAKQKVEKMILGK